MDEYFAGLMTWWATQSSNAFYIGIGGRLRNNIARQDEVFPYCVFTQVDGIPEYFQDGGDDELYFIENQFDIYSETNSEVLDLGKKAISLFDDITFSVSGWNIIKFNRIRNLLMPVDIGLNVGKPNFDFMIHRYLLSYETILQKV